MKDNIRIARWLQGVRLCTLVRGIDLLQRPLNQCCILAEAKSIGLIEQKNNAGHGSKLKKRLMFRCQTTRNNVPGANAGVSKMPHATIYLPVV
jgi:hypothetical protein